MEGIGWKPLDLIVGGMLTAGVAFGVYKLGAGKVRAGGVELDGSNLQECIALAGRPSELEVSVLPQSDAHTRRLAASLAKSIQASYSANDGALVRYGPEDIARLGVTPAEVVKLRRSLFRQTHHKDTERDYYQHFEGEDFARPSSDRSPPKRRRGSAGFQPESYASPLMACRTPPELTRQLQSYRDTLDKWTADSEAKLDKMEQQRMALATELHVTREALQAERRHRAEAEQRRQRAEAQFKEMETRIQRFSDAQAEASRREEGARRLEQQVHEMEEQLEGLYLHNVVTPRPVAQENALQQQHMAASLQGAEEALQQQLQDMQDMENDMVNLSEQLAKARKDGRQLGEDNATLQKQLQGAQHAARDMVALLYERSAGHKGEDGEEGEVEQEEGEGKGAVGAAGSPTVELTELLNAPDSELPLDKLLQCVTALLLDQ